jgi:hypothetical protein
MMGITDEMLMAYADGELSAEAASEVERALAADETLAEKLALFADSRKAVRQAYATPAAVSAELEARVRVLASADAAARHQTAARSNVISLADRRRQVPLWQLPLAASIALVVGAGSMWLLGPGGAAPPQLQIASLGDPAIADALGRVASGDRLGLPGGAEFAAIASFRDGDGALCREFEHDSENGGTLVAVACRADEGWDVRFAVASATGDAEGYAPASSLDALDAYLSATSASAPLSSQDEAAALDSLN